MNARQHEVEVALVLEVFVVEVDLYRKCTQKREKQLHLCGVVELVHHGRGEWPGIAVDPHCKEAHDETEEDLSCGARDEKD